MRIFSVQNNNANFKQLQVHSPQYFYYKPSDINRCRQKLAKTEFIDVIIDSKGLSIKEKMTGILQKIQSFSLFPKENAVSVNMLGEKEPAYKFSYDTLDEAKENWKYLSDAAKKQNVINEYMQIALWIDNNFKSSKAKD